MIGFQKESIKNQREHLLLILAGVHKRVEPKPEPLNKGKQATQQESESTGNSYFVETRTFWHMLALYLTALQTMTIVAWCRNSPSDIFEKDILYHVSTVFTRGSFLRFLQSVLDFILNFPSHHR
ncbi:hypothetical protein MKX03_015040 [Papaver bracteatum]|nr:hypothetical protein MKX03_015040 [Papaver bracteatum]